MKTLELKNLESLGVNELNIQEMQEIEGGHPLIWFGVGIAIGLAIEYYLH